MSTYHSFVFIRSFPFKGNTKPTPWGYYCLPIGQNWNGTLIIFSNLHKILKKIVQDSSAKILQGGMEWTIWTLPIKHQPALFWVAPEYFLTMMIKESGSSWLPASSSLNQPLQVSATSLHQHQTPNRPASTK